MEGIRYHPKTVSNTRQELKLLLDSQQHEYCRSPVIRSDAGFRLMIHDTNSQIASNIPPSILLSPGYEYTVTLQPVTYDMRNFSESMKRCTSKVFDPFNPDRDYDQSSCFTSCFAKNVFNSYNCLTLQPSDVTNEFLHNLGKVEQNLGHAIF